MHGKILPTVNFSRFGTPLEPHVLCIFLFTVFWLSNTVYPVPFYWQLSVFLVLLSLTILSPHYFWGGGLCYIEIAKATTVFIFANLDIFIYIGTSVYYILILHLFSRFSIVGGMHLVQFEPKPH